MILNHPLAIRHSSGRLQVLKERATEQSHMGEALILDTIVNSIDAELIATGPSGKGPNRGAITRHGRYVLWGFEGSVSEMTDSGRALFINALYYTATCARAPVLEKRKREYYGSRDAIYEGLRFIKTKCPEYLETLKNYLPAELAHKTLPEVEEWYEENRPYLRVNGWQFEVDAFAKHLGVANHRLVYLHKCIRNLEDGKLVDKSSEALRRYTGLNYGSPRQWRAWYTENRDYLYFCDCEGSRFKIDEEARSKRIPTAILRKWSSENLDYRYRPESGDKGK